MAHGETKGMMIVEPEKQEGGKKVVLLTGSGVLVDALIDKKVLIQNE